MKGRHRLERIAQLRDSDLGSPLSDVVIASPVLASSAEWGPKSPRQELRIEVRERKRLHPLVAAFLGARPQMELLLENLKQYSATERAADTTGSPQPLLAAAPVALANSVN